MSGYTSIERSFALAFKQIGQEVRVFEMGRLDFGLISRIIYRLPGVQAHYEKSYNRRLLGNILEDTDIIFYLKGSYLFPATLATIRRQYPHIRQLCFHPDDPFNRRSGPKRMLDCIAEMDHYFIWKKALIRPIQSAGCASVHYLPFAADTSLIPDFFPTAYREDLAFIGNGDTERQQFMEAVSSYNQASGRPIKISVLGENWRSIAGVRQGGGKTGASYFEQCRFTKININTLRQQNKEATNMRTFEIPACGGFMLHEYSEAAAEIFLADKEVVYFHSPKDLVEKARYYLEHDSAREAIRLAGHKKATAYEQSYTARASEILACVDAAIS